MKSIPKQIAACGGIAALGVVGLFGAVSHAQKRATDQDQFINSMETVLAMTPTQKDQAQTAVDQARQAAQPVRQELMSNNRALEDAVKAGDTARIQQLTSTEGQEIGKLLDIRDTAVAKVYKTLTPDQKSRATALRELLEHNRLENQMPRSRS